MLSREVLRIRSFRDLWLGQAISQLGDSIYYVSFMFMAQHVTGSVAMVGYVGAMEMLPYLLLGPYAGVVADRIDRRQIMMLSDLCSAGALVAFAAIVLAANGTPPVWGLLGIPFALSTMRCFFMPSKSAAIPRLVPSDMLTKANALSAATFNVMGLIGLGFAATLIGPIYEVAPKSFFLVLLLVNAASFAASALFIRKLPEIKPDREHEEVKHPWQDFKSGVGYIKRRHDLTMLTVLLAVFRLGVAPFFVVYVAANKEWFGGKPQTLIWFEFSFFLGMVLGSIAASKMKVRRPTVVFSAELFLIGVTIAGMALPNALAFAMLNLAAGIVVSMGDIPIMTYLQASVEDGYRGRVNSVRDMISTGVMPIGMVLGGSLVNAIGLTSSFLVMGAVMAVSGLAGGLSPRYRNVRMPEAAFENEAGTAIAKAVA